MDIQYDFRIKLTITQQEYNLIGLALSGKIKPGKMEAECLELNRKLLEARLREHQHHAMLADKALIQIESLCKGLKAVEILGLSDPPPTKRGDENGVFVRP